MLDLTTPPTLDDLQAAAARIAPTARRTPLVESPLLNARLGLRLLIKAEPLQRTGSFKFRGAMNVLTGLDEATRRRGVVAFSSGNHAQAVAHAAQIYGVPAVIVMPADAPALKIANTRAYGAEVVLYDRWTEDREAIGKKLEAERGLHLVRPFDDPRIVAGQGTAGLEIVAQCAELGVVPDAVLVNCSGGGLAAGVAIAVKAALPDARVHPCEPAAFDDLRRSLISGKRESNSPDARSQCDALLSPTPGVMTFKVAQALLAAGLVADDAEVDRGMRAAFEYFKLVVEPGGAVSVACAVLGKVPGQPKTIVAIASGGNVDADAYAAALGRAEPV